ncbi:MAG: sulfate reduction electron transfer complex DsrMKJOP subunit DsrM [Chlorobium sp.]|nr:sulfate reduction electron transfer complex DsrMKJOP subunit DsrM [Chlorobium sp.]MCW8814643.1 sulfate reduction electron transfer complex DsrMKJOP subunit DsrM [Chlorobium sp.]MCW8818825.1 sulfate reduction electron transfer complex DsrMKJOP subunit DsrM [Ignavibacteriaceae bacterium]
MKKAIVPFAAVLLLAVIPYVAVQFAGLGFLFGIIIPYIAIVVFTAGVVYRVIDWARSPVPFRIPTTCGQEKSLDWIQQDKLENPSNFFQAVARVLSEVLFFRSLFRNTKAELHNGSKLAYGSSKFLWLAGLAFHWSMLVIVLRHYRFFIEKVPGFVKILEIGDGFLDVTLPALYLTDIVILAAVTFLVVRRLQDAKMRLISLPTDYFPLFMILAIAVAGVFMRYLTKVDVMSVKDLMINLVHFNMTLPEGIGALFYVHLFLVCMLAIYFPFSKLMHMGGIFMSPTRNLSNNSREKRHINPWNPDMKIRTYAEYEDEFREKMKKANLPVEKK